MMPPPGFADQFFRSAIIESRCLRYDGSMGIRQSCSPARSPCAVRQALTAAKHHTRKHML